MPKLIPLLALSLLLVACGAKVAEKNPDPNHNHADFAVFMDGKQFDFAQQKYMSEAPKKNEKGEMVYNEIPSRKYLHLHDMNGKVMHRHKPELTLGDFFKTIDFSMTTTCFTIDTGESSCEGAGKKWRMFVNGTEQAFDPAFVWKDLDKILLTYGSSDEAEIQKELQSLTDDACRYSKTCPERGEPPTENCIADPTVPCVAPN